MAGPFTFDVAPNEYMCGEEYSGIEVVRFYGPSSAKVPLACAYCCTINVDIDGDPQAYGPLGTPGVTPIEFLQNGGFLTPDQNLAVKRDWKKFGDQAVQDYKDLLQQKTALDPKTVAQKRKDLDQKIADAEKALNDLKQQKTTLDPKTVDGDKKALDLKIQAAEKALNDLKQQKTALDPKTVDADTKALDKKIQAAKTRIAAPAKHGGLHNPYVFTDLQRGILRQDSDPKPLHYLEKFWHWYGCAAFTPDEARATAWTVRDTKEKLKPKLYHNDPDIKAFDPLINPDWYEDINGRWPVVQMPPQPGFRYFVSVVSHRLNTKFPEWDQRAFLPPGLTTSQPFGALSTALAGDGQLALGDNVFAIHLLSGNSLTFPFLDTGYEVKVAECSMQTFLQLGGKGYDRPGGGPPIFDNNGFFVLYLAFPGGKSPKDVLQELAKTDNADDFPVILSFIAQATLDLGHPGTVFKDPLREFGQWKKIPENRPKVPPAAFNVIDVTLREHGFIPP